MKSKEPTIVASQPNLASPCPLAATSSEIETEKIKNPKASEPRRDIPLETFLAFVEKDISSNPASVTAYGDEEAENDLSFLKDYKDRNPQGRECPTAQAILLGHAGPPSQKEAIGQTRQNAG
jgi:hypothetical protein